jgi:SAM-dependent methyltransferase
LIVSRTLEHLESLGWVAPKVSPNGVRYCASDEELTISYPSAAYEECKPGQGESGFYLAHRADVVTDLLARFGITSLWEIGAGNGNVAVPLTRSGLDVVAIEPLTSGAEACACQGVASICGTLEALRLPDASLPAVGMFDVLEHLRTPAELLAEVRKALEPDGIVIVTVPAGPALWSDLDDALGHFRRYRKETLVQELASVGFRPVVVEYIYACLVPMAAVLRTLPYRLGRRKSQSDVLATVRQELDLPAAMDRAARSALSIEARLSKIVALPFGLSLVAVFRKARQ